MALRTKTIWYGLQSEATSWDCSLTHFFIFDDSAATFTDETADINNATASDVPLAGINAINDILYVGSVDKFDQIAFEVSVAGATGVIAWEYWNGSSWTALSVASVSGSTNLNTIANHRFKWAPPSNWTTTAVNGVTEFWIRGRITTGYTAGPTLSWASIGRLKVMTTKTINIPENTSRTFKSVGVLVSYHTGSTAFSTAVSRVYVNVGANVDVALDENDSLVTTAEHMDNQIVADATSIFVSRFTGTSQNISVQLSFGSINAGGISIYENATVQLFITYEAEEQTTRIKTVHIPLESPVSSLTTSLVELGTNQIPALSTYLPEASKTYRDIYFVIQGNNQSTSTSAHQVGVALDSEAEVLLPSVNGALTSGTYMNYIWTRNDLVTTAAHAFKARTTSASQPYRWLTVTMVVTYEYNHSTSTSIMNSMHLPCMEEPGLTGDNTTDNSRILKEFFIQESSPTLSRAMLYMSFSDSAAIGTLNVRANTQSYKGYTHVAPTSTCGGFTLQHDITSAVSLVRGKNSVSVDWYSTTADAGNGFSGYMLVNYVSAKHASGDGAHNHTVWTVLFPLGADVRRRASSPWSAPISETNYWLTANGFEVVSLGSSGHVGLALTAELFAGEGPGDGWEDIFSQFISSDTEMGTFYNFAQSRNVFRRYPTHPDTNRMNIKTPRVFRVHLSTTTNWISGLAFTTYHSITYTVSGTISGYTGDGSGISVEVFRTDTGEKILSTTTSAGGTYTATWYDNTIPVFATAKQDGTHVGRSNDGVAV